MRRLAVSERAEADLRVKHFEGMCQLVNPWEDA
jgi:hypothetical protein